MAVGEIGGNIALTLKQIEQVQIYAKEIIEMLPPKAINELLEGYNQDQEALLNEIFRQINNVVNFGATLESEKLDYLDGLERGMDMSLRKLSYNYFKTTCLPNFDQNWFNLEWGNLIQLFPWALFLAARGHGKCFSPDTQVVMFDGSLKQIKDIVVGDKVMGIDSTPRVILETHKGVDDMYEVEQKMFKNYTVNSKHDMYFKKWATHRVKKRTRTIYEEDKAETIIMETKDLVEKTEGYFHDIFGVGVDGWDLPEKNLLVEPYFLGYWLGDGSSRSTSVATADYEVVDYLHEYAERMEMKVSHPEESIMYKITYQDWVKPYEGCNMLYNRLKYYNLIENKHIPEEYLTSSRKQRLELLAGMIDSDGHYPKKKENSYVFTQKNMELSKQLQRLCWSLGFRCNISEYTHKSKATKSGFATVTHVHLSGNIGQIPCKIKRKISPEINKVNNKSPQRRGLAIKKIGIGEYCGFTCDKDHLFLLEDGTIVKNSYEWCFAFPIWRLYSYDKPSYLQRDTLDNRNRKETMLITNESKLGITHLSKIIEEINYNDVLKEKLNPKSSELGKTGFTTETGSIIRLGSLSSANRGNHCGAVILDDFLNSSSLWSKEQRSKAKGIFDGDLTPIVEPGGFFLVSGTPYVEAEGDLYTELKKNERFKSFEYPAISPYYGESGELKYRLLNPSRFSYTTLMEIKESIGSAVFSREYLVSPVTDDSSIFPYEYLNKCIQGMEQISFCQNIESYPFKLQKVVIGVDWAISGKISADNTVMTVMGIDSQEQYHVLYIWRKRGASPNEQINQLVSLDQRFRPSSIVLEDNGFQSIMSDLARQRGLKNIKQFTTTGFNKKNSYEGLPSIAAIMERGQMRVPYKEGETKDIVDIWMSEFNSMAYNEDNGKLEGTGSHDDMCMSTFFAVQELRTNSTKFRFTML